MRLVTSILGTLLSLLTPEIFKSALDAALDKIEDAVAASPNKVDDAIVLPLCKKARQLLDVPDNDNPAGPGE